MDGHLFLAEFPEVLRKGEHAVSCHSIGNALGTQEAGCSCASAVDPKQRQDGYSPVRSDQLNQVFCPVVRVLGGDDAIKILDAKEDDYKCWHGKNPC